MSTGTFSICRESHLMKQPHDVEFILGNEWGFKYPSTIIMPRKPEDWSREDAFSYLHELGHYYYQDKVSCIMSERLGCELRAWDYARKCVSRETWNDELVDYMVRMAGTYAGHFEEGI